MRAQPSNAKASRKGGKRIRIETMPSSSASAYAAAAASASVKQSSKPSSFQPANQLLTADFTATSQTVDGKPKGRNVSGRNWKLRPQKRASSIVTKVSTNNRSKSWEKRKAERDARKAAKERETELREEMRQAAIAKKERRLENERRRAENEFKNAQKFAQNLGRNADTKMKAMSKKQLRQIKKTRMNSKTGVVEYVSAYAK